jgi:hypothetical protein
VVVLHGAPFKGVFKMVVMIMNQIVKRLLLEGSATKLVFLLATVVGPCPT